tara:strand:+ start:979 stop:1446 length:468 start_codon:yes stop_codon:yes gene_type:complete
MKKFLVIIFLGILFSGNAYAQLNGVKELYLEIRHSQQKPSCNNEQNYNSDIEINTKYILSNSKVIISKTMNSEFLKINVLTKEIGITCASSIKLSTYSVGYIKNFSGHRFVGERVSYFNEKIVISKKKPEHKDDVLSVIDLMVKKFVVDLNEIDN